MFALNPFVDQGIKFVGVRRFVGPQNKQLPARGNDYRMALKGVIGQSAKGTYCFTEAAGLHFEPKIDCFWTFINRIEFFPVEVEVDSGWGDTSIV